MMLPSGGIVNEGSGRGQKPGPRARSGRRAPRAWRSTRRYSRHTRPPLPAQRPGRYPARRRAGDGRSASLFSPAPRSGCPNPRSGSGSGRTGRRPCRGARFCPREPTRTHWCGRSGAGRGRPPGLCRSGGAGTVSACSPSPRNSCAAKLRVDPFLRDPRRCQRARDGVLSIGATSMPKSAKGGARGAPAALWMPSAASTRPPRRRGLPHPTASTAPAP